MNVSELERKFALKPATSSPSTSGTQSRTPGAAVLHLLDPKKAQNLGILLTSIRATYPDIRRAIVSQDSGVLSVGNAISLIKLLPTEDEVFFPSSFSFRLFFFSFLSSSLVLISRCLESGSQYQQRWRSWKAREIHARGNQQNRIISLRYLI